MSHRAWTVAASLFLMGGLGISQLAVGCSTSSSPASPLDAGQTDATMESGPTGAGQVSGTLTDLGGKPVAGVQVTAGSATASTASDGTYTLSNAPPGMVVVSYTKSAYLPTAEMVAVVAGQTAKQNAVILALTTPIPLDSTAGGTVRGLRGATLTAGPKAFVDSSGKAVTGMVNVFLRPLDPAISNERAAYPGTSVGINSTGASGGLMPHGTLEVTVQQNGQSLQVAPGQTLTIKIPATAAGGAAKSTDLWAFEPETATWTQEGTATLTGGYYTATLHHLCYHQASCQDMGGGCDCSDGTTGTMCAGGCADTDNDPDNCGECGHQCPADSICIVGKCNTLCGDGSAMCDGICVDSSSDTENCGGCGMSCPPGDQCTGGQCTPCSASGGTNCSGDCTDTSADPYNCGDCDVECPPGQACENGTCTMVGLPLPDAGTVDGAVPPPTTCGVTLSGAMTGTFGCSVTAAWAMSGNRTSVIIQGTGLPASLLAFAAAGTVSGQIADKTYPFSSFVKWSTDVEAADTSLWSISDSKPMVGTQSMTINSNTVTTNVGSAIIYTVHGTFDATCPFTSGADAGATVTVHISY